MSNRSAVGPFDDRTLGSLASWDLVTVPPEASVSSIIGALVTENVSAVAVVDEDTVIGVVTERDIVDVMHDGVDIDRVSATGVMAGELIALPSSASLADAARTMLEEGIRHLLVASDGGYRMLSMRDVLGEIVGIEPVRAPKI